MAMALTAIWAAMSCWLSGRELCLVHAITLSTFFAAAFEIEYSQRCPLIPVRINQAGGLKRKWVFSTERCDW